MIACLNRFSLLEITTIEIVRLLFQADLASIHGPEENQFVTDLSDGKRFWLGGKLGWSWSDGTPWDYQNWEPGQPSGGEGCLENLATAHGTWNDRGCTNMGNGDLRYVCKK